MGAHAVPGTSPKPAPSPPTPLPRGEMGGSRNLPPVPLSPCVGGSGWGVIRRRRLVPTTYLGIPSPAAQADFNSSTTSDFNLVPPPVVLRPSDLSPSAGLSPLDTATRPSLPNASIEPRSTSTSDFHDATPTAASGAEWAPTVSKPRFPSYTTGTPRTSRVRRPVAADLPPGPRISNEVARHARRASSNRVSPIRSRPRVPFPSQASPVPRPGWRTSAPRLRPSRARSDAHGTVIC